MRQYIGPKQREIVTKLQEGGHLRMRDGRWMLWSDGEWRSVNRERCMGLYVRGFIMFECDPPDGCGAMYRLTQAGKAFI